MSPSEIREIFNQQDDKTKSEDERWFRLALLLAKLSDKSTKQRNRKSGTVR